MNQTQPDLRRSSRWKFLALVAVFVLPAVIAGVWYFVAPVTAPAATAKGELIQPARPLEPFTITTADGAAFTQDDIEGRWHLVHVLDGSCDADCQERIYYTRQLRDALGHERIRVRRLLVGASGRPAEELEPFLAAHPDLVVIADGSGESLIEQMPGQRTNETVFLVDPLGNIMMRFDADVAAGDILDDLKKLLRISRVG